MNGVTCSRSYQRRGQLAGLAQHLDPHRLAGHADRKTFLNRVVGAAVEHAQQPRRTVEVHERVVGGGADDVRAGPAVQRANEAAEYVIDRAASHGDTGGVGFGNDGFVLGPGRRGRQHVPDARREEALDALRQQRSTAERRQHFAGQAARIPCGPGG